ncbi:MAG: deoxyribose-phosphate aldolase [Candidatus Geothermarchaeota archaeon]
MNPYEVAKRIDHTYIKIDANYESLEAFIKTGLEYRFRSLVTLPSLLPYVKERIRGTDIKLSAAIDVPFGQEALKVKMYACRNAIESGANELDIASNVSFLLSRTFDRYEAEARSLIQSIKAEYPDIVVKYIVEVTVLDTSLLTKAIEIINRVKPDYFKTSTGFGPRGTTSADVKFIRQLLLDEIKIKASGGIRTYEQFIELIKSGADIIGSSTGDKIVKEALKASW